MSQPRGSHLVARKDCVWGQESDFQPRLGFESIHPITSWMSGFGQVDPLSRFQGEILMITAITTDHYQIETETTPEFGKPWVLTSLLPTLLSYLFSPPYFCIPCPMLLFLRVY